MTIHIFFQFSQGQLFYEHNGSKTKNDSFTILVHAPDVNRQSQPMTINVTVKDGEDGKPRLITNTGMQVISYRIQNIAIVFCISKI